MLNVIYIWLFKVFLYPVFLFFRGIPAYRYFSQKKSSQYATEQVIEDIQLKKLKAILIHADETVPFYSQKFREIGFNPKALSSLEDYKALNFSVDKEDIRRNPEAFISSRCNKNQLTWHRTGGSTGVPLNFATDKATDAASLSSMMRAISWFGAEWGDRNCLFWGSPTFIKRSDDGIAASLRRFFVDVRMQLMNKKIFLNYDISESNCASIYKELERFRPRYIRGMPTSLYIFSRLIKEAGLSFKKCRPLFVHSACEQLYSWQKDSIEEVFKCPVLNTYGLSEFGDIAFEAPCGHMHISSEDCFLELNQVDSSNGELIATQLNNYGTPLLKYRTNDIAKAIVECPDPACPISLPIIDNLKGRAHDFIKTKKGRFLHGQFFTHIVVSFEGIVKYQVVQEQIDLLYVSLVVEPFYDTDNNKLIEESVKGYMGSDTEVLVECVDHIPLSPSGKHRWIISKIGPITDHV